MAGAKVGLDFAESCLEWEESSLEWEESSLEWEESTLEWSESWALVLVVSPFFVDVLLLRLATKPPTRDSFPSAARRQ